MATPIAASRLVKAKDLITDPALLSGYPHRRVTATASFARGHFAELLEAVDMLEDAGGWRLEHLTVSDTFVAAYAVLHRT